MLAKSCWQNWKCFQTFMKNYDSRLESAYYSKAHISQNSNECEKVIKNVIKITIFFSKIVINYKSNYSTKNVIRLHYLIM